MQQQLIRLAHLRASIVIMQAHNERFKELSTKPSNLCFRDHIDLLPPLNGSVTDFMRYSAYKTLIRYAEHNPYCKEELLKLDQIIALDHDAVVVWLDKNDNFFWKELFDLNHDLTLEKDKDEHLFHWPTNAYLIKSEWLPVFIFSEVMHELYFGDFSNEIARSIDKNSPNENALSIIEKIKALIGQL
jgi:hypothetical protein